MGGLRKDKRASPSVQLIRDLEKGYNNYTCPHILNQNYSRRWNHLCRAHIKLHLNFKILFECRKDRGMVYKLHAWSLCSLIQNLGTVIIT